MKSKYEKIQSLIELWSEFEQKCQSGDLKDFGRWLSCLPEEQPSKKDDSNDQDLSDESSGHLTFYHRMPESRQFLTLLSRSARFIDFYIKKAFEGLEITSRLEFQFLISIKEMHNPRKTDIIYFNLVEISTGVETLNRLARNKLIREIPDPADKRIKRVSLTSKGDELVNKALKKFDVLDNLTRSFGSDESWRSFIPSLTWFNDFHNEIYMKSRTLNFDDLASLVGISEKTRN
jgi:DNA-binding MarR family transcriptional regulator